MTAMLRLRGHPITGLAFAAALGCVASPAATPALVDAQAFVPSLALDLRYATAYNFVGTRIDGYEAPRCLLSEPAARALAAVQQDLAVDGLGLVAFDCYRPQRAVDHFVRWTREPADPGSKARHHPHVSKEALIRAGYIAPRSGHSRGSTLDVGLVRLADGAALDLGTPFDFFDPLAHVDAEVSEPARANRARLRAAMERRGFTTYPPEWWHFTLAGEPYPDTHFDVPVR
jgi:D-alanyl-D-alanine dipeptidase